MGVDALSGLGDGAANVAIGDSAAVGATTGSFNTVVGDMAGQNLLTGFDNIYIGATAGNAAGDEFSTIRIGDPKHVFTCFVAGITGVSVSGNPVCVGADGQLGECGPGGSPVAVKELKTTTEKQAERIALQEKQIQTLTVALKQQAEQIQRVSAQLEMVRPAPRVVGNQ